MSLKNQDDDLTLRAATAAASFSSRAFSFCFRFFRRVSGTSIACNIQTGLINIFDNIKTPKVLN
jgi:hypothetical protein